jgi:mannosyl-oligosaccharide glucosidase
VDHIGYVSIAPLLLGLIPFDSPKLGAILNVVRDPNGMWSDYGVCSLSKQDSFFGMDENYWRGPIWINMNYLLLQSLSRHYMREGPYQEKAKKIYKELRNNLVNNVFRVKVELIQDYESQGYVWEQYSCLDGKGSRSHPFTGWTSLILMIMSEKY